MPRGAFFERILITDFAVRIRVAVMVMASDIRGWVAVMMREIYIRGCES